MILQVSDDIFDLITEMLIECGFNDAIEEITIYQECEWAELENQVPKEEIKQTPKLYKRKDKKKCVY